MRNTVGYLSMMAAAGLLVAGGTLGCDVRKTQDGEMPKVDVEGGKLPKYDVDAPSVDVKTKPVTIPVPDVDVHPAGSAADARDDALEAEEERLDEAADNATGAAKERLERKEEAVENLQ